MNFVEIKINNWDILSKLAHLYSVSSLENLDSLLLGIVPKMFYRYEITDTQNAFIVVPTQFENKVRNIVDRTLVSSISLSCLSFEKGG